MFNFLLAPEHARLKRVWLVGCGSMGGALLGRWLDSGLPEAAVTVIDPNPVGLPEGFAGAVFKDAIGACSEAPDPSLLVLGVKPQMLPSLAPGLGRLLRPAPMLLSMLAGVRAAALAGYFPGAPVVRMMPNMPARIGRGVTALYGLGMEATDVAAANWLMEAAGSVLWLEDESQFDAVTAVSGSGPAFLFRFIEALTAAGEAAGLDAATAARLALETVAGAGALALESDLSPADLRRQVTSPNGTTQAGLDMLDGDGLLSSLLRSTVRAAAERSKQLASEPAGQSPTPPPGAKAR